MYQFLTSSLRLRLSQDKGDVREFVAWMRNSSRTRNIRLLRSIKIGINHTELEFTDGVFYVSVEDGKTILNLWHKYLHRIPQEQEQANEPT